MNPVLMRLLWMVPLLGLWVAASLAATVLGVGTIVPGVVVGTALLGSVWGRGPFRWSALVIGVLCLGIIVWRATLQPRTDREWLEEFAAAPAISIDGDSVVIEGVRCFDWSTPDEAVPAWETRTYSLSNLRGLDMIVEPFPHSPLMAHTMLSFDFGADGRVVLSIEARREVGERYGSIPGGLNQFELIYLFLDERDALGRRALRADTLYAYPARVGPLKLRAFFLTLCSAAENLRQRPRFYQIIRDNCTTAWLEHSDGLDHSPVGLRVDSILNGRLARLMHERGMMDTDLPYDQAKARFRIDARVREFLDDPAFSARIRGGL